MKQKDDAVATDTRADDLAARIELAREVLDGATLMMEHVDAWPNDDLIVSHVDCAALRRLRDILKE